MTDRNLMLGHRQLEGCLSLETVFFFDISRHGANRPWDGRHTLHQNGVAPGNSLKLSLNHSIFQLSIMHSVYPQILHKLLLWNTLGRSAYSQEHSATIGYAKFGGLTECIMGNWKIENFKSPTLFFCIWQIFYICWIESIQDLDNNAGTFFFRYHFFRHPF